MSQTDELATSTRVAHASKVLELEAAAIRGLIPLLGPSFDRAIDALLQCSGRIVVSGIGKAGLIGAKISATLASTGAPSFFLHPSEALHGDLGRVRREDVVLLLSNSGESTEVLQIIDPVRKIGAAILAVTGNPESGLARGADLVLDCGRAPEACPLGLAPTTSTAALLALGDALAMTLLLERRFETTDYARFHPGGALGRSLMVVGEVMRQGDRMTVVASGTSAHDALIAINGTKGRPGAAIVVGDDERLVGFVTDGDLVRRLEEGPEFLQRPVDEVMTRGPTVIPKDRLASDALRLLREHRIDQIPVVDDAHRPVGLLDVQDLLDARIV